MQRLGQHFLTNRRVLEKITAALCIKPGETIIEIGPGHGELTELLADKLLAFRIVTIEKDKSLVQFLKNKFQKNISNKQIEIIEGNALKILPEIIYKLQTTSYKLIGNIPYYITGHLLRIIGELTNKPELIVLTIQKEVAERIVCQPSKMNLLAASVQFWAEPEILGIIPKKDFKPMPKVDSAIIKLTPKSYILNSKFYYPFIKILFKQPRKTILNNLREGGWNREKIKEICEKLKINPELRPQNLTLLQIMELPLTLNILKAKN